ncbi:MAG TPA: CBS domain-containing protein [Candidatus Binatia bacterium]|nr:CBS domain-containing protein [Candidatus Binatia bacterium]
MKKNQAKAVKEIMMSSPVTVRPGDTLQLASDMISLGCIRHLPVVENGRLLGILSARDVMAVGLKNRSALLKSMPIKGVMKRRVITVAPDTPIVEAARLMADKKIGCLPVLSDGTLVGLVTTTNILRYVEHLS